MLSSHFRTSTSRNAVGYSSVGTSVSEISPSRLVPSQGLLFTQSAKGSNGLASARTSKYWRAWPGDMSFRMTRLSRCERMTASRFCRPILRPGTWMSARFLTTLKRILIFEASTTWRKFSRVAGIDLFEDLGWSGKLARSRLPAWARGLVGVGGPFSPPTLFPFGITRR